MSEKPVLITGSNGLLGQKLVKRCLKQHVPFVAVSKGPNRNPACPDEFYQAVDLTSKEEVEKVVFATNPLAIIHTAAMTNVDQCESEPEACQLINVDAPRFLFEAAQQINAHFQLLSTDFVFDGENGPYRETDEIGPLSVYARSKADAEAVLVQSNYTNWSVVRTIIVYGTGANLSRSNMILWALDALPSGQQMRLVDDQFRAPTWADDLAYACMEIVLRGKTGFFHIAGPRTLSVVEIVHEVASVLKIDQPNIETISSSTLNQAAKRPPKTGFILDKALAELDYRPKTIAETIPLLQEELRELAKSN